MLQTVSTRHSLRDTEWSCTTIMQRTGRKGRGSQVPWPGQLKVSAHANTHALSGDIRNNLSIVSGPGN